MSNVIDPIVAVVTYIIDFIVFLIIFVLHNFFFILFMLAILWALFVGVKKWRKIKGSKNKARTYVVELDRATKQLFGKFRRTR